MMYYIKVSSTLKTCEGRSSLGGPATNKISNYLDCLFVCRVSRHNIPIRMIKRTFNDLRDERPSHVFKPSMLSLLSTSSESVFTSTLSAIPVLFRDDWPVRSSFVSLLNKHFLRADFDSVL